MMRISATTRIVLGLALLTFSVVLVARSLGLAPNGEQIQMEGRSRFCESLAISSSLFITRGDTTALQSCIKAAVRRNPDVVYAALRRQDGTILVEVRNDDIQEFQSGTSEAAPDVQVDLLDGNRTWGQLAIRFRPQEQGLTGFWKKPMTRFTAFVAVGCCIPFFLFLRKTLQHLNPSRVVPERVREALDTLAGGLVILDNSERIVLANKTFAQTLGLSPEKLQGLSASRLPWKVVNQDSAGYEFPWTRSIRDNNKLQGEMLALESDKSDQSSFVISCAPILAADGNCRGVLASFEDVTELEHKKSELRQMLEVLHNSREEIRRKNEELHILATQDPLTLCLNRRAFFEDFEKLWKTSHRKEQPLSCIMLDIDHFKSINDTHGHSTGDLVLKEVAGCLKGAMRETDVLCRYGGEEFCVLLPNLDVGDGYEVAESLRQMIEQLEIPNVSVTSSFGVSATSLGGASPQHLLDEADKSLYIAKRSGRNQVARWDTVPRDVDFEEADDARSGSKDASTALSENESPRQPVVANSCEEDIEVVIPFHAVTALTSALAYRDESTAAHSRRVADLCVAIASEVMSVVDSYVLEVAALLHDIGKIGVPDAILLKPGPLTDEEWKVMGIHDRIGVEIVSSTFASEALLKIIESHHAFFGGLGRDPNLPTGKDIPLGARILTIADAYDAMVSDRVYRKGMIQEDAFAELRRCAGTQFDPELVEKFIDVVIARDDNRQSNISVVTKEAAVRFGEQMERLAHAIDNQDFPGLAALAGRVNATAMKQGVPEIADVAADLQVAACDVDLARTVQLTSDLLDLCRSVQSVHLNCIEPEDRLVVET